MPALIKYAELEISLLLQQSHSQPDNIVTCQVGFSFRRPDTNLDPELLARNKQVLASFDYTELLAIFDDKVYGQRLGKMLFANSEFLEAFRTAWSLIFDLPDVYLRLRLYIDSAVHWLHALHWEKLIIPGFDNFLATSEYVLFSRYLTSRDIRRVVPSGITDLKALFVVASPKNLAIYKLAEIKLLEELNLAQTALYPIPITLVTPGEATIANIRRHLRDGYDILYLVCHGKRLDNGQSYLCLEDDNGNAKWVSGDDLAKGLTELTKTPKLVILAACHSADAAPSQHSGVSAAVGPSLVAKGIPAVIAMHGNINIKTVDSFMRSFFEELRRDGLIDRATAAARNTVVREKRFDWWAPVLFMRLSDGRLFDPTKLVSIDPPPQLEQLYQVLTQLNYSPQQDLFKRFWHSHGLGAFLISGRSATSGQLWLLCRLIRLLERDKTEPLLIKFNAARNKGVSINSDYLWEDIASQAGLSPEMDVAEIIAGLYEQWKLRRLIFVYLNVSDYLDNILKDIWQTLIQRFSRLPVQTHQCFMFVTNEDEPIKDIPIAVIDSYPDSLSWQSDTPIRLPDLPDNFAKDEIDKWLFGHKYFLTIQEPTLKDDYGQLLDRIWDESFHGSPMPTLKAVYDLCTPAALRNWFHVNKIWTREVQ